MGRLTRLFCLGAVLGLIPGSAPGAPARPDRSRLALTIGVERRYDDNILQLTPHDLDRFAESPGGSRFRIESPDDNVNALRGLLRWRVRPIRRRETRLEVEAGSYDYLRNDVKNWQRYAAAFTQELTAGRRDLATLELWASRIPVFYLGEYTDADDSFAAGRRIRRALTYAQTGFGVRVRQALRRGRIEAAVGYERNRRDYEAHFDERDGDNRQWRMAIAARPFRHSGLTLGLTGRAGRFAARGDLPASEIADVDVSYVLRGLGATVGLPWGRRGGRGRVDLAFQPERRTYTTADKYDVTRHGRVIHRRQTTVRVTQHAWGPFDLIGSYYRLVSDARFPSGVAIRDADTDFAQTRWGLFLRGRWELARR